MSRIIAELCLQSGFYLYDVQTHCHFFHISCSKGLTDVLFQFCEGMYCRSATFFSAKAIVQESVYKHLSLLKLGNNVSSKQQCN